MQRKHQREFEDIISDIIAGSGVKIVDIIATPGAGKSSIPIQATRLIKAGLADAISWIVPRSALQSQGERNFFDPFFRKMFNHEYVIRSSTNEINPCRGTNGFVTTYQAISADKNKTVLREVLSKRYIIILDEPHHLEKDGIWHEAIDPIVQAGHFLIKMTGTLGRGDKKEIAYINYRNMRPYFKNSEESRMILYTRIDALKERAILPIEFHLSDGEFEWIRENGDKTKVKSFKGAITPKIRSEALFTALNSEFAGQMLRECVIHWYSIREKNHLSKLLIVTSDYEQAKNVLHMMKRSVGIDAEIATSHESPAAHRAINRFKANQCDCLVTIAMAYEGLDVPSITHICVLTNIRSREWIEQMLARGVRIDKFCGLPYEAQKCYVFAPMDPKFLKVVKMIKMQQLSAIEYFAKVKEDREKEEVEADPEEQEECPGITPIYSKMTDRDKFLMGLEGKDIAPEKVEVIKTIKEQEIELRQQITDHVNAFCRVNRYHPHTINAEIKRKLNKARDLMALSELKRAFIYVVNTYPVERPKTIKEIPGVSVSRGTGKRVSSKVEACIPTKRVFKQRYFDM
jgi:superfamily II DNA or RNA helicase